MIWPLEPKPETLEKYGLSRQAWGQLVLRQGGVCAVCKKLPETKRLCIDHEHVRGWSKMQPAERAIHVRGLLCFVCNKYYCGRGITLAKARNLFAYLKAPLPFNSASEVGKLNAEVTT